MSEKKAYKIQVKALGKWHTKDSIFTDDRYIAYNLMREILENDEIAQVGRTMVLNLSTMTYTEDLVSDKGGNYIGVE